MDELRNNYGIFETISEDGELEVIMINEGWMREGYILWPPPSKSRLSHHKFLNLIPEDDWIRIEDFKILKLGLKSVREATDRLNFYCMYDNTMEKEAEDAERALKRKHPVRFVENHLDYNILFDELQQKIAKTSSSKSTVLAPNNIVRMVCSVCGEKELEEYVQCDQCYSKILCISCDDMYHRHPLRVNHIRKVNNELVEEHNKDGEILNTKEASLQLSMNETIKPQHGKVGKPHTVTSTEVTSSNSSKNHFLNKKALKVGKTQLITSAKVADLKLSEPKKPVVKEVTMRSPPPLIQINPYKSGPKEIHEIYSPPEQTHNTQFKMVETTPVQIEPNTQQSKIRYTSVCLCFVCGSEGIISCEACASTIFCAECDTLYHKNLLRQQHKREMIVKTTSGAEVLIPDGSAVNDPDAMNTEGTQQKKVHRRRVLKKSNPIHARSSNKQTLKFLKDIKENQKKTIDLLMSVKQKQHQLKLAVTQNSVTIANLKEYLGRKPKDPIVMMKDFKSPVFPMDRVQSMKLLDSACQNTIYRDQIAVRRINLCATNEDNVKAATKRIMDSMFTFGLLMQYSWTGKSELNCDNRQKEKFSELIGIHDVIKTAVMQNLPASPKMEKDCVDAIKENLRRAPQNQARSLSSTK